VPDRRGGRLGGSLEPSGAAAPDGPLSMLHLHAVA
jgi:hypothetical protein